MILFFSFFAASSLAAKSSNRAAPHADKYNPNSKVDSLQMLAMKSVKPVLGVLPKFLETCKSWPTERAWAYSIGRALGSEKDTLTLTKTKDNKKQLLVHPAKIFEFLWNLRDGVWKPDENSSANTFGENIFPRLFDMEVLRCKLASLNKPQTLERIRHLLATCVIST